MATSPAVKEIVGRIVAESNTDILLYNAEIERPRDRVMIKKCDKRRRRPNVLLLLVTEGGNPDAAYRIARCLQDRYEKFTCFVSGYCKSAGTLLLLGASELVFSRHGEIGPLDVQLAKKDDLWESESGLTVMTTLSALHENAQEAFDYFFLTVSRRSQGRITVHTASDIASKLTQALYSPISEQIDPIHMGEVYRSMAIARDYGQRLMAKGKNLDTKALNDLISNYPSHGFVIDYEEAKEKFKNVRECTEDEQSLVNELGDIAQIPQPENSPVVTYLSEEVAVAEEAPSHDAGQQNAAVLEQPGTPGVVTKAPSNIPQDGQVGTATTA